MDSNTYDIIGEQTRERLSKLAATEIVADDSVPSGYVRDDVTGQIITRAHWIKRMQKRAKKMGVYPQMRDELNELRQKLI